MKIKRIILTPVTVESENRRSTVVRDRVLTTVESTRIRVEASVTIDGTFVPVRVEFELEHD